MTVWRCRWCGRRLFGWFHKPAKCDQRPSVKESNDAYLERIYLEYRDNLTSDQELEDWQRTFDP